MKILVIGAGATGGFFGARLAQAGRDVTFLVRPARARILHERGLRLTGLGEDEVVEPALVTAGDLDSPYDLVLVTVKADALPAALADAAPAVGPETTVVPFLNGMAHLDLLNERFGAGAVLGGVVKVLTTLDGRGDIRRLGALARMEIGEQDGRPTERLLAVERALGGAGFDLTVDSDIVAAMWHKWVFISTLAALTSLLRGSVGEIVAVPGGERVGPALLAEAAAVAQAAGHPVPGAQLAATTAFVTARGSDATASLYRDLAAGLPTEVEHILGDLTARARALGVATPLLDLATLALRIHQVRIHRDRLG
ncbi:ketopantoate reductase family protein [Kitasatospora paracochleata]|uniref:2-dehydropantoate 2-reductase n=1 Tax=Kitasatospora paracochleata TaxID=58354 RepID=A0ABT1J9M6_9ACTN|nr:2-dehydropantoate 2-reductase [Kitasatospora paracochleata]MCP2313768.1 2-dehydropantoate 2-reductase [Kitasatospora paracochleata]